MKMRFQVIFGCVIAGMLPAQLIAQTAVPCVTPAEAQAIVQVVLPDVVAAVGERCVQSLPNSAFLTVSHIDLASRYRVDATKAWPVAKAAALRLAPKEQSSFLANLPDEAQRAMISGLISKGLGDSIKTEQCGAFDRILASVAPLPSSNVASFVATVVELGMQSSSKKPPKLAICPAPAAIPTPQASPTIGK